jgi:hypothetical protein
VFSLAPGHLQNSKWVGPMTQGDPPGGPRLSNVKNRVRLSRRSRCRLRIGGIFLPFAIDDVTVLIGSGFEGQDLRPDTGFTVGTTEA